MNKLVKIYSFVAIIFLVSCSDKDMSEDVNTGAIHLGPYYNEFLACEAGPKYSKETITEMLSAWQELQVAEGLGWAGIYAPVGENHRFSNGWW